MLLRVSVLLLLFLIHTVDKIECKKKSTNLTGRRTSHPNPVHLSYGKPNTIRRTTRRQYIQTTTPRSYRTTTRSYRKTTTRRHYITTTPNYMTTTPRTRYTTRRKTTSRRFSHETTTPRRTTTSMTRPPPFNPYFTTRQPKMNTTKQHPSNSFPPTIRTTSTTRQPAFNPFFTSTVRPIGSGLNRTTTISRQPAFNHSFTSSVHPPYTGLNITTPIPRQPAFNPYFTSSIPPIYSSLNKTSIKPQTFHPMTNSSRNSLSGVSNKTSGPPLPTHNSTSNSSERKNNTSISKPMHDNFLNSTSFGSINKISMTNSTSHNIHSTLSPNKFSNIKLPPHNPTITSSRPPVSGELNRTTMGQHGSGVGTGSQYPGNGPVRTTNRPVGFIYHPPGVKRNITSNFGQPSQNFQQNYSTNPIHPESHSMGNYYPGGNYVPGVSYVPGSQQNHQNGLVIINNNAHNVNHQVVYPTQHYGGYGRPPSGVTIMNKNYNDFPRPQYHYTTSDTGNNLLGVYLGYQLGRMSKPSFHYYGTSIVNEKYVPVYDHYEIHHYYHKKESVPMEAEITADTIVACVGDSGLLCPGNTTPLCTNNGAVMCISSSIIPCDKDQNMNCIWTKVPCSDNSSPECTHKTETSVLIPCISTARIAGVIDYPNNTVQVRTNTGTEESYCVTILALPVERKYVKLKKINPDISIPFHYMTNDTGIDPLGYYLGQQLENLESPSYLYLNYDKNYRYKEKYDHYDIHQYYHNGTILPKEIDIKPDTVMACAGDSGTICPQNTRSLCFTDGAVACVADVNSTSFINDTRKNYSFVNSSIPCENNTAPLCRMINTTIPIFMPCISIAKIYANVSNLISNIVMKNGQTKYYNTLVLQTINSNTSGTIPLIPKPRQFCVTVLLTPSEKIFFKAPKRKRIYDKEKTFITVPRYTYSTNETGTNTLGYYLSQRLGDLKYPTYLFMNQTDDIQKYDHYSVHHYHQGKEIVPNEMELYAETISGCPGDSGTFCPANTTTLCLNDSSVMCVTDVLLTQPCEKRTETNCVWSIFSCSKLNAPKCRKGIKRIQVLIPCISFVTVFGDLMYVNNSIYTSINSYTQNYINIQQMPNRNVNESTNYNRVQQFCVTVLVLPAERRISEGEKVLESSKGVFLDFALNMFGIS